MLSIENIFSGKCMLYCFTLLLLSFKLSGQEGDIPRSLQFQLEDLPLSSDDEQVENITDRYDDLQYFQLHPLNINNAETEDLERLQLLTLFQMQSLTEYIKRYGAIQTFGELQFVPGFSPEFILDIKPYICLEDNQKAVPVNLHTILSKGQHQLFIRQSSVLEKQAGYLASDDYSSVYKGNPSRILMKYRFDYRDKLRFNMIGEKDPGEEFFQGSNASGFDFHSLSLQLSDVAKFKRIVAGDYHLTLGQGLVVSSAMSFGKTALLLKSNKSAYGITANSSANESRYFRGMAATYPVGNFYITGFYSSKKSDASVKDRDSINGLISSVSGILQSGMHTTAWEIETEKNLKEQAGGIDITYRSRYIEAGGLFISHHYSIPFHPKEDMYKKFAFIGNQYQAGSFHYNVFLKKISFFGESAVSFIPKMNPGLAFIHGAQFYCIPQLGFTILHRDYQRHYHSAFSNAFSENSSVANEKGVYVGCELIPLSSIRIRMYADHFRFPWLKYKVSFPSTGNEYLFQVDYRLNEHVNMTGQYKNRKTQEDYTLYYYPLLINYLRNSYRYFIEYTISEKVVLANRLEYITLNKNHDKEEGSMIYQDIKYRMKKIPLSITIRYALFGTGSYDTRIYCYENDVLYSWTVAPYYANGSRSYIVFHYQLKKGVDCWLRLANFYYTDKNTVSSGLTEIQGNKKTEIKVQCRIGF